MTSGAPGWGMMTATFVDRILGALGDNGPRVDSAF